MVSWRIACIGVAFGCLSVISACTETSPSESPFGDYGQIRLALEAKGPSGKTYRLRDATFSIDQTYTEYSDDTEYPITLSTEDDIESTELSATVVPGSYRVRLSSDWRMEVIEYDGSAKDVDAVLLSSESRSIYVYNGQTYFVEYIFGIGTDIVEFRRGDIKIGIQIEEDDSGVDDDAGY